MDLSNIPSEDLEVNLLAYIECSRYATLSHQPTLAQIYQDKATEIRNELSQRSK